MTKEERIAYRKKNIIGYEELFNSTRRQVLIVWWDGIISGNKSSEDLAMMVMVDTQITGMKPMTYPKRKFKMNGR
jgi:hypothetical protein